MVILAASTSLRAWYGLEVAEYWDETFPLRNAVAILETGSLEPQSAYYPLVTHVPQAFAEWCLESVAGAPTEAVRRARLFTIARMVQVAYGTLALIVLYLLGSHLFGRATALLAVLAAGFAHFDIWAWGYFKPDALQTLSALLALFLSVKALGNPSALRFALAGASVALAASSKLTAGVTGGCLTLGVAFLDLPWPRRVARLVVAGSTALITIVLLNPFWKKSLEDLSAVHAYYLKKAAREGATVGSGLKRLFLEFLPDLQGPVAAALFLIGAVWLTRRIVIRTDDPVRRGSLAVLLSFPVAFSGVYFLGTSRYQGNNFAPIVPVVLLIAVAPLVAGLEWTLTHWRRAGAVVSVLTVLGLGVNWIDDGFQFVYRTLIPSTSDEARRFLVRAAGGAERADARLLYVEAVEGREPPWQFEAENLKGAITEVQRLDAVEPSRLDLADGEIFLEERLSGSSEPYYHARTKRPGVEVSVFPPHAFVRRGPALVAVAHPWIEYQISEPVELKGAEIDLAPVIGRPRIGSWVSLVIWIPFRPLDEKGVPVARVGNRSFDLHWVGRREKGHLFLTDRFSVAEENLQFSLLAPAGRIETAAIEAHFWREASSPPQGHTPQ